MLFSRSFALSLIFLALPLSNALADDLRNSKDHPLITRYPGTEIVGYRVSEFVDFRVATGPLIAKTERTTLPPVMEGEGKATSISYRAVDNAVSSFQIFRNFENAFQQSGFREIYSCDSDKECGKDFVVQLYWYGDAARQGKNGYLNAPLQRGPRTRYFYWSGYVGATNDSAIVSLIVTQDAKQIRRAVALIDVYEPDDLELGKVTVNLDGLNRAIRNSGRAVLDGILFDLDKATLKSESTTTVAVVAEFLKANPTIDFYVVGHTDNTGDYEYNQRLSEARASTVAEALHQQHGIATSRLKPIGIGPVSPATANTTDSGRGANRRVELVQR